MKTVAIHLASGFEETEAITIIDILRRGGLNALTVSVTGDKQVIGSHHIPVICDKLFDEIDYNQVDMIVLPGGMPGSANLDAHAGLKQEIMNFDKQNKWLAAICAAPLVFGRLHILQNKRATCYPGFETELHGAITLTDPVVTDGHLITSRGIGTAIAFAIKCTELLENPQIASKIARSILADNNLYSSPAK